jgi:hypothetical protein
MEPGDKQHGDPGLADPADERRSLRARAEHGMPRRPVPFVRISAWPTQSIAPLTLPPRTPAGTGTRRLVELLPPFFSPLLHAPAQVPHHIVNSSSSAVPARC